MKKLLLASFLIASTAVAQAQFTGGTATDSSEPILVSPFVINSVSSVRQMPDDTYVTVEGNIISQEGRDKDKYLFKDATGEIIVDIDKKLWKGQMITPETTVKILGELDQNRNPDRIKIDAVYIEVAQ